VILERHYLACLSQASYLIVDPATGVAAVVDPRRDVDLYVDAAARHGATIAHVFLTHFHADFVSGHLELRARTGATIYLGARARAEFPFEPLEDGARVEFGSVRVEALATPGHTPESTTYLVYDLERNRERPHAALTGDTLFIGDVGRPDLMASVGVTAEELAAELYRSTREKLLRLPDATLVYPGHGAGSLCGKSLSDAERSTIGDERRSNPALRPLSAQEFIAEVTAGQPPAPAYFGHDAALNRQRRAVLDDLLPAAERTLDLEAVLAAVERGAQLLDVRGAEDFAAGHLAGSLGIGLSGKFASWAGLVLDPRREVLLVGSAEQCREAAVRLGRVGFERTVGRLDDLARAFARRPDLRRQFPRVEAEALPQLLGGPDAPQVLDVRTAGEWAAGHLPGATHIPLDRLASSLDRLPRGQRLLVTCQGGYRSSIAAGLLERAGIGPLVELRRGMGSVAPAACTR
jgi:hydroxyacylglutathione hydrolase